MTLDEFIDRFEAANGIAGVRDIILDRFSLYAELDQTGQQDAIHVRLQQLIVKSTSEQRLIHYRADEPLMIIGALDHFALRIEIMAHEKGMLPAVLRSLRKFYKVINQPREHN
jgi:hypothetical protein